MKESEVWAVLTDVFRVVFDDDRLEITSQTTAEDIDAWDSVTHVQLVVAIEERFGIRVNTGEIIGLDNVGQMAALIVSRTS